MTTMTVQLPGPGIARHSPSHVWQIVLAECDHYLCRGYGLMPASGCVAAFGRCCGCCAPDYDGAWERMQDL